MPHKNPSVPSEHLPTDKDYAGDGRKLKDLPHVGATTPDADPEQAREPRRDNKR